MIAILFIIVTTSFCDIAISYKKTLSPIFKGDACPRPLARHNSHVVYEEHPQLSDRQPFKFFASAWCSVTSVHIHTHQLLTDYQYCYAMCISMHVCFTHINNNIVSYGVHGPEHLYSFCLCLDYTYIYIS